MSLKDYHYHWAYLRKGFKGKLANFHSFKKFSDEIYKIDSRDQIYHIDQWHPKIEHNLFYSEGAPNFNLFKLTPAAHYMKRFDVTSLWESRDIDYDIFDKFNLMSNVKYQEEYTNALEYDDYNLFLMQMSASKDRAEFEDALRHSKDTKTLTLFKSHPVAGDMKSEEVWKHAIQSGLVSDYSIFVDGVDLNILIENCNIVYSADSAATLNAVLLNKPVATYRKTDLHEIVSVISSSDELKNVSACHRDTVLKFLSWYYYRLCINTDDGDFVDKIRYIVESFNAGKTFSEIFK